jgi:hypothetical protein
VSAGLRTGIASFKGGYSVYLPESDGSIAHGMVYNHATLNVAVLRFTYLKVPPGGKELLDSQVYFCYEAKSIPRISPLALITNYHPTFQYTVIKKLRVTHKKFPLITTEKILYHRNRLIPEVI